MISSTRSPTSWSLARLEERRTPWEKENYSTLWLRTWRNRNMKEMVKKACIETKSHSQDLLCWYYATTAPSIVCALHSTQDHPIIMDFDQHSKYLVEREIRLYWNILRNAHKARTTSCDSSKAWYGARLAKISTIIPNHNSNHSCSYQVLSCFSLLISIFWTSTLFSYYICTKWRWRKQQLCDIHASDEWNRSSTSSSSRRLSKVCSGLNARNENLPLHAGEKVIMYSRFQYLIQSSPHTLLLPPHSHTLS